MRAVWLVLIAVACNGEETGTLPADSDGAGADCGTNPPVIETLDITFDGMSDPAVSDVCGAEPVPMLRIQARATDEDGDLHYWQMRVRWDETVDAAVAATAESVEVTGSVGLECGVFTADVATLLCLGGEPPYNTEIEWAAVVSDDLDHESNEVIAVYTTPSASGE